MKIKSLFESKFIKVFDLQYGEGRHYYNATRRDEEDLVAAKSTEEFKKMLPDAVSCVVICNPSDDDEKSGHEPCLLMNREFRYPTGQYLLSVPAGLIDPEDCTGDNDNTAPLIKTAMRELHEETGLKVTEKDTVSVINPCLFSTPGMTDESNALVKIVLNHAVAFKIRRNNMNDKKYSLRPYLLAYKWHYAIGIFVLLAVDLANLYIPQFIGEIIDGITAGKLDMAGVGGIIFKILITGLIIMAGRFGWRYFIIGASRGIEYRLRDDMFSHMETLSARYYNSHKTGDLMAYFTNDLQAVRMGTGMAVITVFDAVIMTVMVLVKMVVYVDFKLTLFAFIPLIFIAIGCYFYGIESKKRQVKRQDAFSYLSDKVQESIAGIRVVKAFAQEEEDFKQFEKACENSREKNLAVVKLRAVFGPTLDAVIGISVIVTLLAGGRMVLDGQVSIGQFVAFNSYIDMLVWPMIAAGDCINTFSQAAAAWGRIQTIFEEKPDIVDMVPPENVIENDGMAGRNTDNLADGIYDKIQIHGDIQLSHLSFTYPDGSKPVLSDVSIHVKQGEMLGILGRTGSGKSSLADLLLRVYDCENGMILLDGRPITDYPLAVLHRDISYVPQENFLFSDTLEENIAFGLEDRIADNPAILDAVKQAAKDACIHDNIMGFPDEYKTMVGERGVTLSGGQKQRSSIARALLKDSAILILDDSLSAVDTDTEEQILENLMETRQGKTTIVIAHRISTLQKADHVAVLSDGKLTEYGTPEELLELGGFYADISHKQQLESELGS